MKKLMIALVLVALTFTLSGCTTYKLVPVAQAPNQRTVYINGDEVVISEGQKTAIVVGAHKPDDSEVALQLAYINTSNEIVDALPELISIQAFDGVGPAQPLQVYSADDYLKKLRTQQAWEVVAQALNAIASSLNAGQSTTYTTYSGHAYGSGGYASAYGSVVSTTYDPSRAALVSAQNQENMSRLVASQQSEYQAAEQALVKRTTLFPGQSVEGLVIAKWKRNAWYRVTIPFGTDIHTVDFKLVEE